MFEVGACWQYQVKESQRLLLPPSELAIDVVVGEAEVRELEYARAKQFIEQYEWLGNLGSAQHFYGLFFREKLLAVVCFARPTSSRSLRKQLWAIEDLSVFQLCRGATAPAAPKWAASFLISRSLKMLARTKRVCVVVAYADPRAGEVGVVYQSANAYYLGEMDSRGPGEYVILGRRFHPRTVHRVFGSAKHSRLLEVDPDYQRIQRTKKHRYVFVTARAGRRKRVLDALRPFLKEAPKR